jgi:catechol 2,3-dioxygenase-like lactoylglutathione lyase family enzyme
MAPPLVNVVVIGARDIDRLRAFYEDLGWPPGHDGGRSRRSGRFQALTLARRAFILRRGSALIAEGELRI